MRAAILCTLLAASPAAQAAAETKCKLEPIAEWLLRPNQYRPVVDGAINGQKIGILLDTGSGVSVLRRSAAAKLGVTPTPSGGPQFFGIGGGTQPRLVGVGGEARAETALIGELRIGDTVREAWPAVLAGEGEFHDDVAFILGDDFFEQLEVEFDLPHNAVRLFQAKDCESAALGYWSKEALAVPLESGPKMPLSVLINGKPVVALLDSGATLSWLSLEGAMHLGITAETRGVIAGGCVRGIGKERTESWIAPLESFAIGDEVVRNPKIRFANLWLHTRYDVTGSNLRRRIIGLPDMLLGADFLRSHRVLVAHSQRKIYFSYSGGTVFPSTPGKPCADAKN